MKEKMIERMARAMFEDFMDWQFGEPIEWEWDGPEHSEQQRANAERDWRESEWKAQGEFYTRMARAAMEAMIDAALHEKEGSE